MFQTLFPSSYSNKDHRYEKQLDNVDDLVLETLKKKKNIYLSKRELYEILEVCHEYRVIE